MNEVKGLLQQSTGAWDALVAIVQELREISVNVPHRHRCTIAALSVVLSVTIALTLRMDDVWWAAISGFISSQATLPDSLRSGALRIAGTAGGAALALLAAPVILDDQVACAFFLLVTAWVAIYGMQVSPHAHAWLFFGVTAILVTVLAISDPFSTFRLAASRTAEVMIGTGSAILLSLIFARDGPPATKPPAPGWLDVLGEQRPAALHALRCGIAVMLLPTVWSALELPSAQVAVTVAAVMALPVLSELPLTDERTIILHTIHRMMGCALGGAAALMLLAVPITHFAPWIVTLAAGVWVGTHIQASMRGVGYVGTQATLVYILILVQGWGPPASIMPGLDRFIAVACGLGTLLLVSLLWWLLQSPSSGSDLAAPGSADHSSDG